jgi:hypothetical protein
VARHSESVVRGADNAQRGFRKVQALARFGHTAFFGHGHQQLEVSTFQFRTHVHMSVVHRLDENKQSIS